MFFDGMKEGKDESQLGELADQTFKLAELVSYQDGAIVSRTLVDKDCGTLTVFAYDEGQTVSEHTASHTAMAQVLEGKGKIIVNGKEFIVNEGESIALPSGTPHSVKAPQKFKMFLIMVG